MFLLLCCTCGLSLSFRCFVTMLYYVPHQAAGLMATMVVLSSTSPILLLIFLPLGVVYGRLQRYYRRSSRELRRLDSTSRWPLIIAEMIVYILRCDNAPTQANKILHPTQLHRKNVRRTNGYLAMTWECVFRWRSSTVSWVGFSPVKIYKLKEFSLLQSVSYTWPTRTEGRLQQGWIPIYACEKLGAMQKLAHKTGLFHIHSKFDPTFAADENASLAGVGTWRSHVVSWCLWFKTYACLCLCLWCVCYVVCRGRKISHVRFVRRDPGRSSDHQSFRARGGNERLLQLLYRWYCSVQVLCSTCSCPIKYGVGWIYRPREKRFPNSSFSTIVVLMAPHVLFCFSSAYRWIHLGWWM